MAQKTDQIWKVFSGTPVTPPQKREGIRVYNPEDAWTRRSTEVTLPALGRPSQLVTSKPAATGSLGSSSAQLTPGDRALALATTNSAYLRPVEPSSTQAPIFQLDDREHKPGLQELQARYPLDNGLAALTSTVDQLQQAFSNNQARQKSLQAALLAEVLALGKQVDGIQTQQQLRQADTSRAASSPPAWLSLAPKVQQAQEEVQAVKGDVVSLGQALSRLTQRVEAHDQQGLDRSQAVADMSQKQWMECRKDVDMDAKLLQKLQQAQKSSVDQRMVVLETSLLQSMDSSLTSQSGLAHQISSGLQDLKHSLQQEKANQAAWEQAVVQDILGGMAAMRFFCRDLEQAQQQGLAHLHSLHQAEAQAQSEMQAKQHMALSLATRQLQARLQELQGTSGDRQAVAAEQHTLLLAAQRRLYAQQSRLMDSVEVLRREIESVAVEQTLQSSIADADLSQQTQAAASADREAMQSQLAFLQTAQTAAESHFTSALASQQSSSASAEAQQATQLAAMQQQLAAVAAAGALQSEQLPQQLSSLHQQLLEEQSRQLTVLQESLQQVPQQLQQLRSQLQEEQVQQMSSLQIQLQEEQLQQQLQHQSSASEFTSWVDELKLAMQQLQQKQQHQEAESSKAGAEVSAQHAADLISLKEEIRQLRQQQQQDAEARVAKADEHTTRLRQDLQQLQEQLRLQTDAHMAAGASEQQQLRDSLSAEFSQRLESASAQASSNKTQITEMRQTMVVSMSEDVTRQLDARLAVVMEQELGGQVAAKLAVAGQQQQAQQQAVLTTQFNGFKIQLGDVLSHQLADALSTERTKTDAAIAQVKQEVTFAAVSSKAEGAAESQKQLQHQLLGQLAAQREALSLETSQRIASAIKEHNLDVASQVSALGQQINSAMTAKQDMWTAKTAQLQDARQSEGQRLQSTEALTVTLMADADALKAQLQTLKAAVDQLESKTSAAGTHSGADGGSKAWAADVEILAHHVNVALETVHGQVEAALIRSSEELNGKLEGSKTALRGEIERVNAILSRNHLE